MRFKIIAIILFCSVTVLGQINTEKQRLGLPESGISGDIKISYKINRGNSDLTEVGINPGLIWRTGKHQVFMLNDLTRVSSDDGSIINKGFSHIRYNYDFTRQYILEFFLQAQYNRARHLDNRYLAGTGIRLIVFKHNSSMIALGLSGMYEYEELIPKEITKIARGSYYITLKINKTKRITFTNTVYIQPSLSDFDDYRILSEGDLSVYVTDNFALTTSVGYRYDSKPPENIKNYDLELKNGLKFSF